MWNYPLLPAGVQVHGWVGPTQREVAAATSIVDDAYQTAVTHTTGSRSPTLTYFWGAPGVPPAFTDGARVFVDLNFVMYVFRTHGFGQRLTWSFFVCLFGHELSHVRNGDHCNPQTNSYVKELLADWGSGRVAKSAGITAWEIQYYAAALCRLQGAGNLTHPAGVLRLDWVLKGFNQN